LEHPVDADRERLDVRRLDRWEHPYAQLVAAELAIGLHVHHPVSTKRRRERGGVDRLVEVDRADDQRALRGVSDEGARVWACLSPAVEMLRGGARPRKAPLEAAAREHPAELVSQQQERGDR